MPAERAFGWSLISSSNAMPNHSHDATAMTTPSALSTQNVAPGELRREVAGRCVVRVELMGFRVGRVTAILSG